MRLPYFLSLANFSDTSLLLRRELLQRYHQPVIAKPLTMQFVCALFLVDVLRPRRNQHKKMGEAASAPPLTKCIRMVHQGQFWVGTEDLELVMSGLCETKPFRIVDSNGLALLTRREEDVVRLVVERMKNREIAHSLQVSDHSVRNYLYRIFEKLGVSSRVELILHVSAQQNPGIVSH